MDIIELIFVIITGLSFGSFITLATYRLPRDEDIVRRPSRCPVCDNKLEVRDLFPVFSWLLNKARCRHCKAPVHWRYPLIELVTAALFALIYLYFGLTLQAILLAGLIVALLIMCVVDFEHYLIPDQIHLFLLPLGFLYQWIIGAEWQGVLMSAAFGGGIGLALRYGYQLVRRQEGLGWGDVKFLAVVGAWLPVTSPALIVWVPFLFFSGVVGVLTALIWRMLKRGAAFPFGPALAASLALCVMCPQIPQGFWNMQRLLYQ